jgi:hypothetical protein
MSKSDREIMEILEAFDTTGCAQSAAKLADCDPKTVRRYAALRDEGRSSITKPRRGRITDAFGDKIEELVEHSKGKIRADKVHERLAAMGLLASERTVRRAVAEAKSNYRAGSRRIHRPWIPEPGLWCQFDWGQGPKITGRPTQLFCAWLAWSRYRVVIPTWDRTLQTLIGALDQTLRRLGGSPVYLLTDNERTVTAEHVAGIAVRNPQIVLAARHYGTTITTCVPADPQSKGGAEATVKIAKADLLPRDENLRGDYRDFDELSDACERFTDTVNRRIHRETRRAPVEMLTEEQTRLHLLPDDPYTHALGETRRVDTRDRTIRYGSVRYSTPPGFEGREVFCRVQAHELVIAAITKQGVAEIARHTLSTPGNPQIADEHYPDHKGHGIHERRPQAKNAHEAEFLALGEGAEAWLIAAASQGASRVRTKMARAVEMAALVGKDTVDHALRAGAAAGRFGDRDLEDILAYRTTQAPRVTLMRGAGEGTFCEEHSTQPGTAGWVGAGR